MQENSKENHYGVKIIHLSSLNKNVEVL